VRTSATVDQQARPDDRRCFSEPVGSGLLASDRNTGQHNSVFTDQIPLYPNRTGDHRTTALTIAVTR